MAIGMHAFDKLLQEPGYAEEVMPHTAKLIKEATDNLLSDDGWDVLDLLRRYEDYSGCAVTFTSDNGRNIKKAFDGKEGLLGAAHVLQTTYKWTEEEAEKVCPELKKVISVVRRCVAKANNSSLNPKLKLANFNKIPSAAKTR